MNGQPTEANGAANAGLGEVHRLGQASESIFRRLYSRLNRRQEQLLRESQAAGAALQRDYQRLQSEHRQRSSELQRLQSVLGSLDEGIIVQDINGKVTMMNQAAEEMLGSKRAFWHSALGTLFERYRDVQVSAAELTPLGESDELSLNNRVLRAQLIAIGDENKQRIGTVIILRDLTYDALAVRLKDGFVAHVAQEMENPANVIRLASELLRGLPEDSAVNQQLLGKLLRNVHILDQLALELLDIARLRNGSFDVSREPLLLEEVIWSVANGIDPAIKSRGIDLLVMTRGLSGLQVRGDAARLQWALGHLLRNGADYNKEGGYVALAARTEWRNARQYALISVSYNGSGISPLDMPHIFDRFYRGGQGRPDAPRGAGQGLYVAKAICEAHGGFLQARSQPDVGSIFTLGLPTYTASES